MDAIAPDGREAFFRTKLEVPRVPAASVRRERLLVQLDAAVEAPLTLVSAPAGSGKTSVLATWVSEGRPPGSVAWLSLGPEDGERRRFWSMAVAAMSHAAPPLRSLALPPSAQVEAFLPALVDVLMELKRPLILVLDDFHEVGHGEVVSDLELLLDHAPQRLRLVVSTRRDPPMRLERLRLAGSVAEVRAKELAFTLDESHELGRTLRLGLATGDVETLWRRTEGWVAGLRLAGLSLKGSSDPHAFVESFAGDDRAVTDYLAAEVISRQPPETLDFLKRTAISERLNGDLADAMTGGSGGDRTLARLVHGDGMVDPLDEAGAWYRYHPLFRDVLRIELVRSAAGEVPELHRRAACWHAAHEEPLEAVRHAVAAEDWELTGRVAGEHWLTQLVRGHGAVMLESLRKVPERNVRACPELALAKAGLLLDAGETSDAEELLGIARELGEGLPEERRRRLLVAFTATDLYRARLHGNVEQALRSAKAVLAEDWERHVAAEVRALTLANLGIAEFWDDRMPAARRHLSAAVGIAHECNDYVLFLAQAYAAGVDLREGRLDESWRRAQSAVELASAGGWTGVAQAGIAYLVLARIHLHWNDLDVAAEFAERAGSAVRSSEEKLLRLALAFMKSQLLAARGEPATALDVLRGGVSEAPPTVPRFLRVTNAVAEADLLLALGEREEARVVLTELAASENVRDASAALGRLELADGHPEAAIRAVASFLADDRDTVQPNAQIEAWVIDAVARDGVHDDEGALRALERAMDLAEPRGYRRPFVRHGGAVRSLVKRRIRAGTAHRAFAGELLGVLGDEPGHKPAVPGPLLEPLSDRELAVLRFLPTMMSNAEIAAEMFVSVNTVKTHLKHVYRKLDVADRREAVRRARELHLLSPGLGERSSAQPSA